MECLKEMYQWMGIKGSDNLMYRLMLDWICLD